jgi:hypothetical protein
VWWCKPRILAFKKLRWGGLKVPGHLGYKVKFFSQKEKKESQALVAHAWNPSYSGGRD